MTTQITQPKAEPAHSPFDTSLISGLTSRVVAGSGTAVQRFSPIGHTPLAQIPQSTAADVDEAFDRARRAQVS